jgi:hypothetical protein
LSSTRADTHATRYGIYSNLVTAAVKVLGEHSFSCDHPFSDTFANETSQDFSLLMQARRPFEQH